MGTKPSVCAHFANYPEIMEISYKWVTVKVSRFSFYLALKMIPVLPTFKWEIRSLPRHRGLLL